MQEIARTSHRRLLVITTIVQVAAFVIAFAFLGHHDINTPAGFTAFFGGVFVFSVMLVIQFAIWEKMMPGRKYLFFIMKFGATLGAATGFFGILVGLKFLLG